MSVGKLFRLTSKNIFTNLAAEERLFQRTANKSLLFYVNSDSVVLGRTQNPFKEVDVRYASANSIPIARRRSGGGTVVHDEGNLNFCFVRPREEHEPLSNARLVASVLREDFGIKAVVNDRADILVEGMKVSGAAYRLSRNRAYHHGTLLIHSDLERLKRVLRSPLSEKLTATGTKSVPSPVTNLSDHCSGGIDTGAVVDAIADRFSRTNAFVTLLSADQVERQYGGMQAERGELCSHGWVYGKIPRFSFDIGVGGDEISIAIGKGAIVSEVSVKGADSNEHDRRTLELASFLTDCFANQPFDGKHLAHRIRDSALPQYVGIDGEVKESLARDVRKEIPCQFWRDEGEISFQAYS